MATDSSQSRTVSDREPTIPPAFREYASETLPNATPRGHGKDGLCSVTLGRAEGGPTRLLRDRTEVPLHLTGTLDHDPIGPTLCIQEPTGGVAQGDRHRVTVEARTGARGVITTQSAAKVHTMHSDYAHLDAALDIGPGAHIEYVPGPTIVNEDARCLQTMRVDLASDATAICADILVPDGLSDHDAFSFDHYQARLEARHNGEVVCADAVDLRPAVRDPRTPTTVGDGTTVGTLYVLTPDADDGNDDADGNTSIAALADCIHERLTDLETDEPFDAGASTLPFDAGVGVRVIAAESAAVERAITAARDEARTALYDVGVPDQRRY